MQYYKQANLHTEMLVTQARHLELLPFLFTVFPQKLTANVVCVCVCVCVCLWGGGAKV